MSPVLKCTLQQSLVNKKLVQAYFEAWQNHDIDKVRHIFDSKASYLIMKVPRKVYKGVDEICNYWIRNKNRQRDLAIKYAIRIQFEDRVNVDFEVKLFDLEEEQLQLIEGKIEFHIKSSVIAALKEYYTKTILE